MPPINPVPTIPTQAVERSQQSGEQARNRKDEGKDQGKKKGQNNAADNDGLLAPESSSLQLMSQAVDSAKVVELLSQSVKTLVPRGYKKKRLLEAPGNVTNLAKKSSLNKAV